MSVTQSYGCGLIRLIGAVLSIRGDDDIVACSFIGRPDRTLATMTQTSNPFVNELAKLMTDAAGAAQGARQEVEGLFRAQADRVLAEMDVVRREEFEAVKAMAQKAREENEALAARIADARLASSSSRRSCLAGRTFARTGPDDSGPEDSGSTSFFAPESPGPTPIYSGSPTSKTTSRLYPFS